MAVLAVILLVSAIPRLVSGLQMLRHADTGAALARNESLAPEALAPFIESREAALAVRGRNVLALNQIAQANIEAGVTPDLPEAQRAAFWQAAEDAQIRALALAPAEPYGWARLSYLRRLRDADPVNALEALRLSSLTAPYEPPLMVSRAVSYYQLMPWMTEAEWEEMPEILRRAHKARKWEIRKEAERLGFLDALEAAVGE